MSASHQRHGGFNREIIGVGFAAGPCFPLSHRFKYFAHLRIRLPIHFRFTLLLQNHFVKILFAAKFRFSFPA
jgi:hypothetical protein